MYFDTNKDSLTIANLLALVRKDRSHADDFPYTKEICRCRYCRFCCNGKCALKSCCCIAERVKARACTFVEAMNDCFINISDHVFHYRLRLAAERFKEEKSCFLSPEHRKRFYDAMNRNRQKNERYIAQIYILTATEGIWNAVKPYVTKDGVLYNSVSFHNMATEDYIYYSTAFDFANNTSHLTLEDLSNDEIVDFDIFRVICCAITVSVFGGEVLKLSEPKKKRYKNKREGKPDAAE